MRQSLRLWQSFYCDLMYTAAWNWIIELRDAHVAVDVFALVLMATFRGFLSHFRRLPVSHLCSLVIFQVERGKEKNAKKKTSNNNRWSAAFSSGNVSCLDISAWIATSPAHLSIGTARKAFSLFILPFSWMKNFFTTSTRGRREALEADCVSRDVNIIPVIIMESDLASGMETAIDRTSHSFKLWRSLRRP